MDGVMNRRYVCVLVMLCSIFLSGMSSCAANWSQELPGGAPRPAGWARPIMMEGVPNLHKVSDDLYRSGQPTAEGMKNLHIMGIKTVVNLRAFHSDRDEIGDTGLLYEHIPMVAWHATEGEAVRFLKIVTDPGKKPVLVHCFHGSDRTGAMVALYRIAVQGWTKEEAIREMTEGGFGFHEVWINLAPWINGLDIGKIRKEAGIATPKTD